MNFTFKYDSIRVSCMHFYEPFSYLVIILFIWFFYFLTLHDDSVLFSK